MKSLRAALVTVALLQTSLAFLFGKEFYDKTLTQKLSLNPGTSESLLLPFNTTRVPGSVSSAKLQSFIRKHFEALQSDWLIEPMQFTENNVNFANLVFTLGRNASSYLMLAAHYDSKKSPVGFIGATDSAASCAILLYISEFVDSIQNEISVGLDELYWEESRGLKIVFFDGEEALDTWTPEDSIYGAKNLASLWEKDGTIQKIEAMVLLDLLGSKDNVTVPSYFEQSDMMYRKLADIKEQNADKLPFKQNLLNVSERKFLEAKRIFVEDDHIPFWKYGIPVLHLIPIPFPSYWHTKEDDFSNLDESKIRTWAILLCELVYDILD
ncbi:LAQU0S02e03708g1_1 [Lachancea quebecensis]|uniref:Peptide hydrolase n=1 Tax=Lachancea quebecensis TaxID=1654605 RepID=A0A0P1KMN6_9SACH|nr:LAQU0S02e03708g1_1 [Lachancea quebecensis]